MNKPFDIVLMVGMPGSGKTTFCRERLFPSHLYISLDQLRTRSSEAALFAFALKRHKPCVIDNTNVTAAERGRYIPQARKDKDARIVVYCFAPDLEGCLVRNGKRTGREHVPETAIKCKLAKFEPPDFYRHGELQHRKWAELQDMCWQKGHNWNNLEAVCGGSFFMKVRESVIVEA